MNKWKSSTSPLRLCKRHYRIYLFKITSSIIHLILRFHWDWAWNICFVPEPWTVFLIPQEWNLLINLAIRHNASLFMLKIVCQNAFWVIDWHAASGRLIEISSLLCYIMKGLVFILHFGKSYQRFLFRFLQYAIQRYSDNWSKIDWTYDW